MCWVCVCVCHADGYGKLCHFLLDCINFHRELGKQIFGADRAANANTQWCMGWRRVSNMRQCRWFFFSGNTLFKFTRFRKFANICKLFFLLILLFKISSLFGHWIIYFSGAFDPYANQIESGRFSTFVWKTNRISDIFEQKNANVVSLNQALQLNCQRIQIPPSNSRLALNRSELSSHLHFKI